MYRIHYTLDGRTLCVTMPSKMAADNVCRTLRLAGASSIHVTR